MSSFHSHPQKIGKKCWLDQFKPATRQGSRPVVVNGILYDSTGDRLEANDARTGEMLWSWQDAAAVDGERRLTPPVVAHGRVLGWNLGWPYYQLGRLDR